MAYTPDESSTGMPPTTAAGLASVFSVFGATYFWFAEKRSRFVKLYIHQSLRIFPLAFFGGLLYLAGKGVSVMMSDSPLAMVFEAASALLYLAWLLCLIALSLNAFQGKVLILPMFGAGLKKKLGLD
jgi:hypothetical protein